MGQVTLSDTSRALVEIETTVTDLDKDINAKALELIRIQQEMSQLITQRDALLGTSAQIQQYRNQNEWVYRQPGR
jgi:hypothetical protein